MDNEQEGKEVGSLGGEVELEGGASSMEVDGDSRKVGSSDVEVELEGGDIGALGMDNEQEGREVGSLGVEVELEGGDVGASEGVEGEGERYQESQMGLLPLKPLVPYLESEHEINEGDYTSPAPTPHVTAIINKHDSESVTHDGSQPSPVMVTTPNDEPNPNTVMIDDSPLTPLEISTPVGGQSHKALPIIYERLRQYPSAWLERAGVEFPTTARAI